MCLLLFEMAKDFLKSNVCELVKIKTCGQILFVKNK